MTSPEDQATPELPLRPRRKPASLVFRLIIPITGIFVLTIFIILTHDLSGDPDSATARFFEKYGNRIIVCEAAAAILMAIIAMAVDRARTLRSHGASGSGGENDPGGETGTPIGDPQVEATALTESEATEGETTDGESTV